ncbi:hypothetical protein DFJ73DRAFT_860875 [Zopfochytrium polystomum]|nr:hypothetical protein DFJ73DRAFT_860875 [Zopfochytrium polystomum]
MDVIDNLHYFAAGGGFTLNAEERATISASLKMKADAEKMTRDGALALWGKVMGLQRDYWIASCPLISDGSGGDLLEGDNLFAKKFYYSTDMIAWLLLPDVTPDEMEFIEKITKKFTGDPAFEYSNQNEGDDANAVGAAAEGGEGGGGGGVKSVNEEKRLAGVIAQLNYEVQVVPRGAFFRDATLTIKPNPLFTGLSRSDMNQLTSYFHLREGFDINSRTLVERAGNFDETIDIFETIAKDEPKGGSWSLQVEKGGHVAVLRSLLWPGYVFFHAPSSSPSSSASGRFGSVYYGWGIKNHNIGFML